MTSEQQFVHWLAGIADVVGECPTPEQWATIKSHLKEVINRESAAKVGEKWPRSGTGDPSFDPPYKITC